MANTAQEPAARFEDTWSVGWVSVPIVVRGTGGYARGLTQRDFQLFVGDREVPIEQFETGADAPVQVVILQDLSGSMATAGKLEASREAARWLLDQARQGDRFAVAGFAHELFEVSPLTGDFSALREVIASWNAYGKTALHDAVGRLPTIPVETGAVKRAALLITDGVDNASEIDAAAARALVQGAELPVYVLGFSSGSPYAADAQGRKLFRNADMLNLLAHLSGGKYYAVSDPDDWKEACVELLEDLRQQYVLGFTTAAQAPTYHRLRVELRRPAERRVWARRGYSGGPPLGEAAVTP